MVPKDTETVTVTVVENIPETTQKQKSDLKLLQVEPLRKLCREKAIQWGNIRGKGKHMNRRYILAALADV